MNHIDALFVDDSARGVYVGLPNVSAWGLQNDARLYSGPGPVIAHPPCARWGRYWFGSPSSKVRHKLGDDGGCFASALRCVREYGGVLEHPAHSHAWPHFGLPVPSNHGWSAPDAFGGRSCRVEQGFYGHRARKPTWLYAVGIDPWPELVWGFDNPEDIARTGRRGSDRQVGKARAETEILSKHERAATPAAFRDILIAMAMTAHPNPGYRT